MQRSSSHICLKWNVANFMTDEAWNFLEEYWLFRGGLSEKGTQLFLGRCDLHRNYVMVVILLSFPCNYDNLILKLHHKKRSYPDKRWLFIGRFKAWSVPGKSVALVASKKYQNPSWVWCKAINKVIIVINSPIYK